MIKILRYTEYLYLAVFGFSVYRIYTDWNIDRQGTFLFIFFAVASLGMFIFRRTYRKKFEKRKRDNER